MNDSMMYKKPQIVLTNLIVNLFVVSYLSNIYLLIALLLLQVLIILFNINKYKEVFIKTLLIVPFTLLISFSFLISGNFNFNSEIVIYGKSLIVRVVLSMMMIVYVTSKYDFDYLLSGLSKMKLPIKLVNVLNLTYRYFVMIKNDVVIEQRALNARGLHSRKKKKIRVFGEWIGGLLLKSSNHSEKIYYALNARGFNTNNYQKEAYLESKQDLLYLVLNLIFVFSIIMIERMF